MSLLLDALKKAEEAKRRKLEAEGAPAVEATPAAAAPTQAVEFPSLTMEEPQEEPPAASTTEAIAPPTASDEAPGLSLTLEPAAPAGTVSNEQAAPPAPEAEAGGASLSALDFAPSEPPAPPPAETHSPSPPAVEAPPSLSLEAPATKPAATPPVAAAAARFSGRSGKPAVEPTLTEPEIAPAVEATVPTQPAEPAPPAPPAQVSAAHVEPPANPTVAAPRPTPAKLSPEAARQLFDAKKKPARAPMSPKQRLAFIAGFALLGIAAAGGWLWWQTQPHGGITPAVIASPPSEAQPATTPQTAPGTPPAAPSGLAVPPAPETHAPPVEQPAAAKPPVAPKPGDRAKVIEVPPDVASSKVHFARSATPPGVPAPIQNAYQAFERGDYGDAMSQYKRYLDTDPHNQDALLGAGAAAIKLGHLDEARRYYSAARANDPKDPNANAALASLANDGVADGSEGRLKELYESQPTPATASALGSLLARQSRWREAQDYYFRAYTAAPDEPDFAFNLAVSLDALGERRLAAQYYGKALGMRGGSFDRAAAQRRLNALGNP